MQFSSLFLKSSMTWANNWRSIGQIFWRMASFKSLNVRGFMSVNTRFQIPPEEKITRWKIGRARRSRHISETGNEIPGKHVWNTGHCQVSIATEMANPQKKNADHLAPPPYPGLPTEYYPFKRCQVPVGHPVSEISWWFQRIFVYNWIRVALLYHKLLIFHEKRPMCGNS